MIVKCQDLIKHVSKAETGISEYVTTQAEFKMSLFPSPYATSLISGCSAIFPPQGDFQVGFSHWKRRPKTSLYRYMCVCGYHIAGLSHMYMDLN